MLRMMTTPSEIRDSVQFDRYVRAGVILLLLGLVIAGVLYAFRSSKDLVIVIRRASVEKGVLHFEYEIPDRLTSGVIEGFLHESTGDRIISDHCLSPTFGTDKIVGGCALLVEDLSGIQFRVAPGDVIRIPKGESFSLATLPYRSSDGKQTYEVKLQFK